MEMMRKHQIYNVVNGAIKTLEYSCSKTSFSEIVVKGTIYDKM